MNWIKLSDKQPDEGLYFILSATEFNDLMPSIAYFDPNKKKYRWCDQMLSHRKEESRWHDQVKYWMHIEIPDGELKGF